jgi:hypothetical protein
MAAPYSDCTKYVLERLIFYQKNNTPVRKARDLIIDEVKKKFHKDIKKPTISTLAYKYKAIIEKMMKEGLEKFPDHSTRKKNFLTKEDVKDFDPEEFLAKKGMYRVNDLGEHCRKMMADIRQKSPNVSKIEIEMIGGKTHVHIHEQF